MQQFNIDISQPRGPLVLYASQGDAMSRFFSVTVTDNGAAYTPPDGAIYTVRFGAPGMPAGWYDTITEVGGSTHPAVVVDENTYTVEIAEQAVSKPGQNALVLIVSDVTGYTLASWAFELQVEAVPGYEAPEATVYYNALSEQVAQVLASAQAAAASAALAESWAVGGTGTRPGEDTNNAEYWASEAQRVSQGALGWYETEQALKTAHPTGENGQWAIIGSTDTIWTWDSDTNAWVNSGAQVDLSNYYTKAQADAAFATAAQGALAASAVQSVNGKAGTAVTLAATDVGAAPASDGISTYTCVTSGTTHALNGTGSNIKFVADAAYNEGDIITVNGTTVTAQTQDGTALSGGAWAAGAVVVCYLSGTTLNFKGASGGLKPGQLAFVSALEGMNKNTYKTFDTPYFSGKVCQRNCRLNFFTAAGYNAGNVGAGFNFEYGVNINGIKVSSVLASVAGADNLVYDLGTFDIEQGDTVEALIVGVGAVNQRGGAIIGVLA